MASTQAWIKAGAAALWLAWAGVVPADAASFQAHRGINMDAWTTWAPERKWNDAAAMLPFPEWQRTVGPAELARLKAAGLDFVRIPVDPDPFLSPVAGSLREKLYASVVDAVRTVNAAGLKAIVDMHLMPSGPRGGTGMEAVMNDPDTFDAYLNVVRRMAGEFRTFDPALVAFEPMNEPMVDCEDDGTSVWPERQRRLWAAARASAPRLTIVLTGACLSSPGALSRLDPREYPDDNLIWTFHSYWPFLLTHQGATWAGDFIPYVTGLPFPLSSIPPAELEQRLEAIREKIRAEAPWSRRAGLLAYLDEQVEAIRTPEKLEAVMDKPFQIVAAWAKENGVEGQDILLGEFGMIRQEHGEDAAVPAADRAAYVRAMAEKAEARGFAWSVWSYGGAFGVVDAIGGAKAEPNVLDGIRALLPFPDSSLRPATE